LKKEIAGAMLRYANNNYRRGGFKMPKIGDNIITAAVPDPGNLTVTVKWVNGAATVNKFGHLVGRGVFADFADPAIFAQVSVGERGRSLKWPGERDLCADALWFETHPADAPPAPAPARGGFIGPQWRPEPRG
jgi:hypothetical protein